MRKNLYTAILALILGGGSLFFLYNKYAPSPDNIVQNETKAIGETSNQRLLKYSQNYAKADSLRYNNKFTDAADLYMKTLSEAKSEDRGQVDYLLGLSLLSSGQIASGIDRLKSVAQNTNYNNYVRAYAVHQMGARYFQFHDSEITKNIFNTEPYSQMYDSSDVYQSYRHLFEYASSIQPIAMSELRIARWYADEISRLSKLSTGSKSDTDKITDLKKKAEASIKSANEDILRILKYDADNIVAAFFFKAVTLATLSLTGDDSLGSPEPVFEEALNYISENPNYNNEISVAFNEASYLAKKYGEPRKSDIQSLLSRIYNNQNLLESDFYLRLQKQPSSKTRIFSPTDLESIDKLVTLDSNFKKLLVDLGWKF
ncbi:MAG: hypothetical protein Q7S75_02695 [bacterium]|nr:hypothetical protein [bacterium]